MTGGLALGGFMGSGKSTVARATAARLGWPWVDTDELVGRWGPIDEQVRTDEAGFRARERYVIEQVCDGPSPIVLATGGGVWADPGSRSLLRRRFVTVTLVAPLEVLAARVAGSGRPLWDAAVEARFEARRAAYLDADAVIDASRPLVDVVDEVLRVYASRTGGDGWP